MRQPIHTDTMSPKALAGGLIWAVRALVIALLVSPVSVGAQQLTTYHMGSQPDNSMVYALPRTQLYLTISYRHKIEEPGKLALYSRRYLGAVEPILKPSQLYELGGVVLGSYGTPDSDHRYAVKFGRRHDATDMTLSEGGILLGMNSTTASLTGLPTSSTAKGVVSEPKSESAYLALLPPTYLQATTDAKRAEIVAEEIYQIRESRTAIVSGQSEQPFADGAAMALAVERLDASESKLSQLFLGTTTLLQQQEVLQGISIEENARKVIARFSERYGLLDASDLRGEPIYLSVKILEQAPELSEKDQKRLQKRLSKGIAYRVPGMVEVSLTYQGEQLVQQQVYVGQLGSIEVLDATLFDSRNPITEVDFHSTTGGIKEIRSRERGK